MAVALSLGRVSILSLGAAMGAAVGEVVTRRIDAGLGRVQPFRRITDFYRMGLLVVGAVGTFMDAAPEVTEPLFIVGLYGTAVSLGESLVTLGQGSPAFSQNSQEALAPSAAVPLGAGSPMHRTTQPEFNKVRAW